MRAALYGRVSTLEQEPENQLIELRRYALARDWSVVEYVDRGSAAPRTSARPSIAWWPMRSGGDSMSSSCGALIASAGICATWSLCWKSYSTSGWRLCRSAKGSTATSPAGRLQLHILAALAEFERARIAERVRAGLARALAQGTRLGRPNRQVASLGAVAGLSVRAAARKLGVSPLRPSGGCLTKPCRRSGSQTVENVRHSSGQLDLPTVSTNICFVNQLADSARRQLSCEWSSCDYEDPLQVVEPPAIPGRQTT